MPKGAGASAAKAGTAANNIKTGTFLRSRRNIVINYLSKGTSVIFTGGTVLLPILPAPAREARAASRLPPMRPPEEPGAGIGTGNPF